MTQPIFSYSSKEKDLGSIVIKRALPTAKKRMVGPFIFFDHMGPATLPAQKSMNVGLHPHIGLSTLTYLLEGHVRHRDSLGVDQVIEPGDVNWMTAGSGISHMETSPQEDDLSTNRKLHGLQFWVALPDDIEDMKPEFTHYNKKVIPKINSDRCEITVIVGKWQEAVSPVKTQSETLFLKYSLQKSGETQFETQKNELAVYVISGELQINENDYKAFDTLIFSENSEVKIKASADSEFVVFGGLAFKTEKHIWWNFVSSSKEKIQKAKENWNAGHFQMVDGISQRILAPEK
jgi:redox-sensitive bicupin YhaK (pirin superfamily)